MCYRSIEQCNAGEFLLYAYAAPTVILSVAYALWCVRILLLWILKNFILAGCYNVFIRSGSSTIRIYCGCSKMKRPLSSRHCWLSFSALS